MKRKTLKFKIGYREFKLNDTKTNRELIEAIEWHIRNIEAESKHRIERAEKLERVSQNKALYLEEFIAKLIRHRRSWDEPTDERIFNSY